MRIVIKVGTSTLAHATGRLNIQRMERLCKVLSDLKNAGHEIILVSSGAIGMGVGKLNLPGRPADMPGKQAAAAVGQCELMYFYDKLFAEYNHIVAQLLLTGEDIRSEQRSRNVRNTLSRLLELGALPVINENDAVATDEIGVDNTIGENDSLSAIVAAAIGADLLILLSDIDGLYDSDPHKNPDAHLIETVPVIDAHILSLAGDKGSALATGGMVTKLHAAQIATAAGCEMVIANGEKPEVLYDIVDGKRVAIGSHHFLFDDEKCTIPDKEKFDAIPDEYSHLYMAIGGELAAVLLIEDPIRTEAPEVIEKLHSAGFTNIVMMTGDSDRTAKAVAAKVGVDRYFSEVLPEDKASYVKKMREEGHKVIMIGDGINDAPALAAADTAIAMGGGTDVAIESSDITLLGGRLSAVPDALEVSRATMGAIRLNLAWALLYNVLSVGAAAFGVVNPSMAAAAMSLSSIAVLMNSLRLKKAVEKK